MMTTAKLYARACASTAIAAALALSSTATFAQDAGSAAQPVPVASDPAPEPETITPPATVDTSPAATDTSTTTESTTTTVPAKPKRAAVTRAKPAPLATKTVAQKVTTTHATHAAVPVAAAPVAAVPVAAPTAPTSHRPPPIVDLSAKPAATPAPVAAKPASQPDETAMMLGGGALALIALGGGAYALSRRRRTEDDVIVEDGIEPVASEKPVMAAESWPRHDSVYEEQPAIVAPSAFAWGNSEAAESDSDESHVERAMRGPTPENPSLSLRKRLKRAAFFDQRDRQVAAGDAEPVEADAGLPESMDEPAMEREHELA